VTGTEQFVFSGNQICEERDASGTLTKQFFARGQTTAGTSNKYFYGLNRLGSICSITDSSGNDVGEISYDPWGRATIPSGSFIPDFGYAGMYLHQSSGLNLTTYRPYSPLLARWLSRDPSGEAAGLNLFAYAANTPITAFDPLGLDIWVTHGQRVGWALGGTLHTQICVNTRDECCEVTGWRCFSWSVTFTISPLAAGGQWYEEPFANLFNPLYEGRYRKQGCSRDRAVLNSLVDSSTHVGVQGPYLFSTSHTVPSDMFDLLGVFVPSGG
jgi:RHS repeat-associated protein